MTVKVMADRGATGAILFGIIGTVGLVSMGITGAIIEPTTLAGVVGVVAASKAIDESVKPRSSPELADLRIPPGNRLEK
jgi:hypothetical protein